MANWSTHAAWIDLLLSGASGASLLCGPQGECLGASLEALRMLGLNRPQFDEKRFGDLDAFLRLAFDPATTSKIILASRGESCHEPIKSAQPFQGHGHALIWQCHCFEVPGLGRFRLLQIREDGVTEATRVEKLEAERALMNQVLRQLPFGIIVCEAPSGRFLLRNEALTRFSEGMYSNPNSSADWQQYGCFHEDGRKYLPEELPMTRSFKTGEVIQGEVMEVRLVTGKVRFVSVYNSPIQNESGGTVAGVAAILDVTEQVRARRGIEFLSAVSKALSNITTREELLSKISELTTRHFMGWCILHTPGENGWMIQSGIGHTDPAKVDLVLKSQTANKRHGAPGTAGPAQVFETGQPQFMPHVQEEDLKKLSFDEEHFSILKQLGMMGAVVVPLDSPSGRHGTLTVISSARAFEPDDLVFVQELASRFALAWNSIELMEQLRRAVRLRDEVLSLSSHEIRTPLTSLKLLVELLLQLLRDPDRFTRSSDRVLEILRSANIQVDNTTALLDQLLDLSRIDSGKFQLVQRPVSMSQVVEDAVGLLRLQLEREKIQVQLALQGDGVVLGDPIRLRQLVTNLVTNAMKYGGGGKIEIRVEEFGSSVRTSVVDRGDGIPIEIRKKIFNRFDRGGALEDGKGHGLGLYISRNIVEAHRGKIWVEESTPRGATFVVELPADRS
jgi:signal transduction histidine kinase/PAS domain-containing protein